LPIIPKSRSSLYGAARLNLNATRGVEAGFRRYNAFVHLLIFSSLGGWGPMKFRKLFFLALPAAIVGMAAEIDLARTQDSGSAVVSNDLANKINLGLFNWKQDANGNMIASFVMSNYGNRDFREITIGCDYTLVTGKGSRKIEHTLKDDDLATRLAGEFLMRAGTGRHYIDINFGSIDPVKSVRYMSCQVSNAKF
jgi:hypothetical protein